MAPKDTTTTRRLSRGKRVASLEARRRPAMSSVPVLGAYESKHPQAKITRGHKRVLQRKAQTASNRRKTEARRLPGQKEHNFLIFVIKHILTSANLVFKDGSNWSVRENIAGVNSGESFNSLSACAQGILSSLASQYKGESPEELSER